MQFIVVMGCPGSGKTTLSCNLAQETPASNVISCGDLYRNHHYKYPFLEVERNKGKEFWIEALKQFIILALKDELSTITIDTKIVIIDGLWGDNLIQFQQEIGVITKLYYIICNKDLAKKRLIDRKRYDDTPFKINSRLTSYFNREPELIIQLNKCIDNVYYINQK